MSSLSKRLLTRQVPPPEHGAATAAPARFIPKEELAGYSTWTPDPLGVAPEQRAAAAPARRMALESPTGAQSPFPLAASDSAPAGGLVQSATGPTGPTNPTAPTGPTPAELEALQQAARQAGYHDGYRDGLAALESFKRSFAQQMAAQIGQMVRSMEAQVDQLDHAMSQALLHSAIGLARQVVRSELVTRPELVGQVARDAVAAITLAARHIEMAVHPDDLALVQDGLGDLAERRGVVLLADPTVQRGGCRLRSEVGSVDAGIETRWAQAVQRLGAPPQEWAWETPS